MDKSEQEPVIRRILVALDASTHSLAALQAAAELAARMHAELIGLYVEDENLLHLAGLPFAQEVHSPSARSKHLESGQMERQLRLQASQARRALEEAAERVEARWSFRIIRGQVTASVLNAALETDLLAMGRISRPVSSRSKLGSTARAATSETQGSVLFMQQGSNLHYPVLVTYDGSPPARQALATAAQLARASGDDLNILLLNDSPDDTSPMKEEVGAWLEQRGQSAIFHWLPQATVEALVNMIRAAKDCVLVLGGKGPLMRAEAVQALLDMTDCPVLLVR